MNQGTAPRVPRILPHNFAKVPSINIERSKLDRSHGRKLTFNAGLLIPILLDEVLPGDTFNLRMNAFCRMSTPIFPVMDNMYLETFFFFVPMRLLWSHWEQFNGYQANPGDSTSFLIPQIQLPGSPGALVGSLADYFGLPTGLANTKLVNSYPFRAYNLIWNDWFRDQNLQSSVTVDQGDGPDTYSNYSLLRRGKRFDYFTSCLPFTQKGPTVTLPISGMAPVKGIGKQNQTYPVGPVTGNYVTGESGPITWAHGAQLDSVDWYAQEDDNNAGFPGIFANLSNAVSASINALRLAEQLQVFYERDARGGTRYVEVVKSHFGVDSPDARLQRPEYLGGGSSLINIHPVPQTAPTSGTNYQGNLAAFGTGSLRGHGFNKSFVEHGVVIGLACVRADLTYQQGLERMWSRQTREDFYWPAFAHLGEQAVLNQEIYCQGDSVAADTQAFGYQERYAEYRYKPSQICGQFRSTFSTPLDAWHLAQKFTSLPTLGATFIQENPPMSRVEAAGTQAPDFIMDAFFDYKCARPMPVYGVPTLGDRL